MNFPSKLFSPRALTGLALLTPAVIFMSGCVVEETARVHRPVYVEAAPPPPVDTVLIETPPPPLREEIIVAQPSPDHVWIRGYWGWHGGQHVWFGGRWVLPPRAGAVWVEPRWEHRDHGYVFIAGSWRNGAVVHERVAISSALNLNVRLNYIAQPPPPPRHEIVIESQRPSREYVWIKGYYVWRENHHVWLGGHWERPPHPHAVWVEPRWEQHPEGHLFIAGYWR